MDHTTPPGAAASSSRCPRRWRTESRILLPCLFAVEGCATSPSCRRRLRHFRPLSAGRGLGRMAGRGPRSRENAGCAVAGLRPRRCALQFLAIRRHALPSMKHPRRLSPGLEGVPELLVAQRQPRLLAGRYNRRPLGLPGLASQETHQAMHRRRHLGSRSHRGQTVQRLASERKEPAGQPDPQRPRAAANAMWFPAVGLARCYRSET